MINFYPYFTGYPYNPYLMLPQQIQLQTEVQKEQKKTYNLIDDQKRELLIKLTQENNQSIKQASEILNINLSTSKAIIKIFKNTGRTKKIKKRKKKVATKKQEKKVISRSTLEELKKQLPKLSQQIVPQLDPYSLFFSSNYRKQ